MVPLESEVKKIYIQLYMIPVINTDAEESFLTEVALCSGYKNTT
ncbi:MAG: hypothetical protein AB3K77_01535 [Methanosarcinaceae archaeon]